jgi:hypothetical protein
MARALALVAAAVLLAVVPAAAPAQGGPDATDVGALAQAILRGADDAAAQAALRARDLPSEGAQRLLQEIARQARVYRVLDAQQVRGLAWENAGLNAAFAQIETTTGLSTGLSLRAATEKAPEVKYSLRIDASNATTLLDLMTEPFGLAWGLRDGGIRFFSREELSFTDAPAPSTVQARIASARVTLGKEGPLAEIVAALRPMAGLDLVVDPRVTPELSPRRVSARWDAKPLREALDALVAQLGVGVAWTTMGDAVLLTHPEFVRH